MFRYRQFAAATARQRGFSLVELNVALIIAGVVTLSVGAAMVFGTDMSVDAKRQLAVKQDAAFALRFIQRRVREMYNDELEVGLNGEGEPKLTLYPDTADEAYFEQSGSDLRYVDSDDNVTTLVDDCLEAVAFGIEDGEDSTSKLLSVTLTMDSDGRTLLLPESLTLIRNVP